MSSDNELIPASEGRELQTNVGALKEISKGAGFLPRLQLCGSSSDMAKEGKISIGHYGLVEEKGEIDPLGKEVDVLVCAGRTKALRTGDPLIVNYDHKSETFAAIAQDAEDKVDGNMYGPEFLLWIPVRLIFVTFFMCNPTQRRAAKSVTPRLRKAATLSSKLIKNTKHSWHGSTCQPCSTPFEMPDPELLRKEIEKFMTAKSTAVEIDSEPQAEEARAR